MAFGTSTPELLVSVEAALGGAGGIAVGNVVGSNLFNLLGVLGLAALVQPLEAPGLKPADVAAMVGVALLVLPLARSGFRLSRTEGAVLVALYLYVGYVVFLLA